MPVKLPWAVLGVGAYLAFTAASFPASVAYRWFAPEQVRLAGVEGTLWSGSAALGSVGEFGLNDIQWELSPWTLFIARVAGRVQTRFSGGFVDTGVRVGIGATTFTDLRAAVSLAALGAVLPIGGTQGQASLDFAELMLRDGWPVGAVGNLRLGDVAVPPLTGGGGLISLGNYNVTFSESAGDGLAGTFSDQGGPLEVAGSLSLSADRAYLIEGVARARPEADAALVQGLELMTGEPNAAGMRTFSLAGSL